MKRLKNILKDLYEAKMRRETKEEIEISKKWTQDKGDSILRLSYDLSPKSLVMDLGGYEGQWTSDIFAKYLSQIYVFEPVKQYVNRMETRFSKNKNIKIFPFGLADKTIKKEIYINENESSLFRNFKKGNEIIQLADVVKFIQEQKVRKVDLMKINIEGGEYDLLDRLIDSGHIKLIDNIQVQFHSFVPDAEERMNQLQKRLELTHFPTYQYKFKWENWKKR